MSRVLIIGATGETGMSIVQGLLASKDYKVMALARPSSQVATLEKLNIEIRRANLDDTKTLLHILQDVDIVVSAVASWATLDQSPLLNVLAQSKILKRFIPCTWGPIMAPTGIHRLRESKEIVINEMKKLRIPYTIIDLGWWYQLSIPSVPSGRGNKAIFVPFNQIFGEGDKKVALIDKHDIGKFTARILKDEMTVNKYVFAYSEILTQKEIIGAMEKVSGEKVETSTVSGPELEAGVTATLAKLKENPKDAEADFTLKSLQYGLSLGVRGDNTPENAKYLGYLDAKELYPDLKVRGFEEFLGDVLEGREEPAYDAEFMDRAAKAGLA